MVGRATVASGEGRVGVVATLVVVVLHIERLQLGEVDAQRAAAVVNVLAVECLTGKNKR